MCDNENTRLYGYKIIRNCCIATMLCVTLVSCNNTEKPVFNDDVTTDTDVRTSAFESDTEDLSLPEFSISDEGVLTAYNGTEYNILMAGSLLSMIPIIIIYTLAQKYFKEGLMAGGVKG
mgnify:CR=1 FL=1